MGSIYKNPGYSGIFLKTKGSIAVFLAVTVFSLSFAVFFSAAHINRGKAAEKRYYQIDLALSSMLADYDREIYKNYGLPILGYNDQSAMRREFVRILMKNGFQDVENAFVSSTASLNSEGVLKELIKEHMESRAVSKLAEELLGKFGIFESFSRFRELLEAKAVIEDVIFSCEKISSYITTDFEHISAFDIDKAVRGDTEYLTYKLDEYRRFIGSLKELIDSVRRLDEWKTGIAGNEGFIYELLGRIDLFSGSMDHISGVLEKAERNMSLIITCIDMLEEEIDITELAEKYLVLDADLSFLLPSPDLAEELKKLDLREVKGGFFDELLLKVTRDDSVISDEAERLLPFVMENGGLLDSIKSFRDFLAGISFSGLAGKAYEQLLINEYIMDKFSYETKRSEDRLYIDEIEYILFGKSSQNENLEKTKVILLLIRTALNYISIHLDSQKTALAKSVGAAVSLLTFGIGGGLIAELIIAAWAVYEAYGDVSSLLAGEKIAVIKSKGDFSIDFGSAGGGKSLIVAGYADYLRLFLIFLSEEVKLGRISNLIYINTGMDPALMFTALRGGYKDEFEIGKGY